MKTPREIQRLGEQGIKIVWQDGTTHEISSLTLRKHCPSASSRAQRGDDSHDAPLSPRKSALRIVEASSDEETSLVRIWGVGTYALGMEWADGHKTGIYTYDFLYELGEKKG